MTQENHVQSSAKYVAYDRQNQTYLVVVGTNWIPSKKKAFLHPSSREKVERIISAIAPAYDGRFECVPADQVEEQAVVQPVDYAVLPEAELQNLLETLSSAASAMTQVRQVDYYQVLSQLDRRISEIYHRIEVERPNAVQMVRTYQELKAVLVRRRAVKNAIFTLNKIMGESGKQLLNEGKIEQMKRYATRAWNTEDNVV